MDELVHDNCSTAQEADAVIFYHAAFDYPVELANVRFLSNGTIRSQVVSTTTASWKFPNDIDTERTPIGRTDCHIAPSLEPTAGTTTENKMTTSNKRKKVDSRTRADDATTIEERVMQRVEGIVQQRVVELMPVCSHKEFIEERVRASRAM